MVHGDQQSHREGQQGEQHVHRLHDELHFHAPKDHRVVGVDRRLTQTHGLPIKIVAHLEAVFEHGKTFGLTDMHRAIVFTAPGQFDMHPHLPRLAPAGDHAAERHCAAILALEPYPHQRRGAQHAFDRRRQRLFIQLPQRQRERAASGMLDRAHVLGDGGSLIVIVSPDMTQGDDRDDHQIERQHDQQDACGYGMTHRGTRDRGHGAPPSSESVRPRIASCHNNFRPLRSRAE